MEALIQKIEAVLFWKQEPLTPHAIARFLEIPNNQDILDALTALQTRYETTNSGIVLIRSDTTYLLVVHDVISEVIQKETTADAERDLSKAALETLAIIMYRGPISRSEIDYIRGVNSQFILRNLMSRGLIEKTSKETNNAIFVYGPSVALLRLLGISDKTKLESYEQVNEAITAFMQAQEDPTLAEAPKDDKLQNNNDDTATNTTGNGSA